MVNAGKASLDRKRVNAGHWLDCNGNCARRTRVGVTIAQRMRGALVAMQVDAC